MLAGGRGPLLPALREDHQLQAPHPLQVRAHPDAAQLGRLLRLDAPRVHGEDGARHLPRGLQEERPQAGPRQVRGEARRGRQGREAAQQTDRLPEGREEEGEEAEEAERVRGGRGDPRHPQLQMPKITKINLLS